MSLLLQHLHVMRKAQEEIDCKVGRDRVVEESDIPKLTYLQEMVKETLCLHPSAPLMMPHKSIEACMIMFSIGSDTSSIATEWELSLLLQHPHVMRKAQEEIDSKVGHDRVVEESDIPMLTYLQAIVKETLRLHPSAPLIMPHKSKEACTVGGFHIPARTILMVNTWAIHRDPKFWNKPLDFILEHFMEKGIEMDNVQVRGIEYEMLPFGGSRRGCPGAVLAMSTVQTTLASLLQSYDLFVLDGTILDMCEKISMTTPRAVPLEVVVKPHLPRHLYQKKI